MEMSSGDRDRIGLAPARVRWRLRDAFLHVAGRAEQIEAILSGFEQDPIVVLRGMPGVGKTQLAAHVTEHCDGSIGLIAWLRADGSALVEDARELAVKLGLVSAEGGQTEDVSAEGGQTEDAVVLLRAWMEQHSDWLIVLDGALGPHSVGDLLPARPGGWILITTNDGGWFEPGSARDVEPLEAAIGSRFLLERTGARGEQERLAADELALLLGGLPLALRQCEAFVRSGKSSLQRYLTEFEARAHRLLRAGPGPVDHRQTVAITFDLAVGRAEELARGARDLLRALAFLDSDPFPRGWVSASGPAAGGDPEDQLLALHAVSLVELSPQQIAVHGLVGEVVRGALTDDARRRWVLAARALVLDHLPLRAQEAQHWPVYGGLVRHLEALGGQLLELGVHDADTVRLLDGLATYQQAQGRNGEARRRFEQALEAARSLPPDNRQRLAVQGNHALLVAMMNAAEGIPLLEEVVELDRAQDASPESLANALNNLGFALSGQDPKRSAAALQEAIGLYSRVYPEHEWPDRLNAVNGLTNLALASFRAGNLDGAERHWMRCLELMRRSRADRRPDIAIVLGNIGVVHENRGHGAEALRWQQQAYSLSLEVHGEDHPRTITALVNLGGARRALAEGQEDPQDARAALEDHREAERRAERLEPPNRELVALAINNQGLDLLILKDPEGSHAALVRALEIRRALAGGQPNLDIAQSLGNIARALVDLDRLDEAEQRYLEVLQLADDLGLGPGSERRALAYDGLGETALRQGQFATAAEHFDHSHRAFALNAGPDSPRALKAGEKREQARRQR